MCFIFHSSHFLGVLYNWGVDYRKLNAITKMEYYLLPNIEELIEQVAAAKYIMVLDLTKGYWQIGRC